MASTLTETVAARLRADIQTCRIAPDAKLRTMALCDVFEVSLAVVREALSRLASEGLVVADPQRGFRVAPVSLDDLMDLTWVRIQIEGLALREAIVRGDAAWEAAIVMTRDRLLATPLFADPVTREKNELWAEAHAAYHAALIGACGSANLLEIRNGLFRRSDRYRRLSALGEDPDARDLDGEHRALADATLARDAPRAAAVLETHLRTTAEIVRAMFATAE